jgi:hypothetical protein
VIVHCSVGREPVLHKHFGLLFFDDIVCFFLFADTMPLERRKHGKQNSAVTGCAGEENVPKVHFAHKSKLVLRA